LKIYKFNKGVYSALLPAIPEKMKYIKNIIIVVFLIFIGIILGWKGKYEYEKAECVRDHDNCYLLKKGTQKSSGNQLNLGTDTIETHHCEFIISKSPLVVQYAQNANVNCDSAYTNLELNFCSEIIACLEKEKMDSLNKILLTIYDSLIIEQNDEINHWISKGDSSMTENVTDYRLIKKLHNKSIMRFLEYAKLEMEIVGVEIGTGRLRPSYENNKWTELLMTKNLELANLIKENE
jgi:hypothetical protein